MRCDCRIVGEDDCTGVVFCSGGEVVAVWLGCLPVRVGLLWFAWLVELIVVDFVHFQDYY